MRDRVQAFSALHPNHSIFVAHIGSSFAPLNRYKLLELRGVNDIFKDKMIAKQSLKKIKSDFPIKRPPTIFIKYTNGYY